MKDIDSILGSSSPPTCPENRCHQVITAAVQFNQRGLPGYEEHTVGWIGSRSERGYQARLKGEPSTRAAGVGWLTWAARQWGPLFSIPPTHV